MPKSFREVVKRRKELTSPCGKKDAFLMTKERSIVFLKSNERDGGRIMGEGKTNVFMHMFVLFIVPMVPRIEARRRGMSVVARGAGIRIKNSFPKDLG
jgi:hypothetical protein